MFNLELAYHLSDSLVALHTTLAWVHISMIKFCKKYPNDNIFSLLEGTTIFIMAVFLNCFSILVSGKL